MKNICKKHGFSLIELSIIIAVIGILAAGSLNWLDSGSITNAQKADLTTQRMNDINDALFAFRVNNNRLPCPADLQTRNDDVRFGGNLGAPQYPTGYRTTYGKELMVVTTIGGADCPVTRGAVPINDLGLPDTHMFDGWGRRFVYHVSDAFCRNDQTDLGVGCTERDFGLALDGTINPGNSTFLNVRNRNTGANYTDVAYIVISHGANGAWGYLSSGDRINPTIAKFNNIVTSINETENGNINRLYFVGAFDSNAASYFDDIVIFKTIGELQYVSTDPITDVIPHQVCLDNQNAISRFTATVAQDLANNVDYFGAPVEDSDVAILNYLWAMQEICLGYYENIGDNGNACPPDINCIVRTCPAGVAPNSNNECECLTGTWETGGC